jgi:hypothetical protein
MATRTIFNTMVQATLSFALLLSVLTGCSAIPEDTGTNLAASAAKREAERGFGWKQSRVEYVTREGDRWKVMIWRVPETPGGFVVFEISEDGKILGCQPGA